MAIRLEDAKSGSDSYDIYRALTTVWNNVQESPKSENYIYRGKVFVGIAAYKKAFKTQDELLEGFYEDIQLGMISEKDAITFSKAMRKSSDSKLTKWYTRYVVDGYTDEAILVNRIMEDYPDERCKWKFINGTRYKNNVVIIMPESIRDLHIRALKF